MKGGIPQIYYKNDDLNIEVMDFTLLFDKLYKLKDHDPFAIHKIKFYFIIVITKNSYTHYLDFKSYNVEEGSAMFIAKNQIHHFTKNTREAQGYAIVFSSQFVDKYYFLSGNSKLNRLFNYHIETPVVQKSDMNDDNILEIASKLHEEYTYPNTFIKSDIMGSLLHVLLLKAERAKASQSIGHINLQWLEIFNKFKNLLEKDYVKTRSSRAYASTLLISYKFLNDIVKELTGKTVKAFIDDFVIIEIKRYLVSSTLTIKEISYQTGFEEPANMIKFFKKRTKTTPFKFRQEI